MLAQLKKFYCLMLLILTPLTAANRRESKKRPLVLEPVPEAAGSIHRSLTAARNHLDLTVAIPRAPYPYVRQSARTMQTDGRNVKYKPLEMEAVDVAMPTITDTSAPRASMSAEPLPSLMMAVADEDINAVRAALARGERLSPEEITRVNPTEAILALLVSSYTK